MSRSTIPSKRPAPAADAQEAAWIADEDRFVLQQAKRKAAIRAKSGRAQPIDLLAVILAVIDPQRNELDDDLEDSELDGLDPEAVFEGMTDAQLVELEKGIETYLALESSKSNQDYWNVSLPHRKSSFLELILTRRQMMKTVCRDRRKNTQSDQTSARAVSSVASDLDKLLGPKNLAELEKLEKQIKAKLASNEPIDIDYWEHLLQSLLTYKARAKLRRISRTMLDARLENLRNQQAAEADALRKRLFARTSGIRGSGGPPSGRQIADGAVNGDRHPLDPEPLLRLRPEDKSLKSVDASEFGLGTVSQTVSAESCRQQTDDCTDSRQTEGRQARLRIWPEALG